MSAALERLGVVFDWDGVLIDSGDMHERCWRALAFELGESLPPGFFARTFGLCNAQVIAEHTSWARADETERIARLAGRKESLYRALVREEGVRLVRGARTVLDELDALGVPVAVGTSAPRENVRAALARLDLGARFAAIVTAEDVARGKPAPDVFLACARALDREPADCVVLEDAPAGVRAAHAAGMRAIGVATTHPASALAGAERVVATLDDLGPPPWLAG